MEKELHSMRYSISKFRDFSKIFWNVLGIFFYFFRIFIKKTTSIFKLKFIEKPLCTYKGRHTFFCTIRVCHVVSYYCTILINC